MSSDHSAMKELYRHDYTHEFRLSYVGSPALKSGGRTMVNVQVLKPDSSMGFININITKDKEHTGSVTVCWCIGTYWL